MGDGTFEAIKAALAARGLKLRKVDGKWETVEQPGGITGLPTKEKEIRMAFVEKKPRGSPGRGPSAGFNLQETLAMSDSDYDLVYADAKVILHRTHGIKMNEPVTRQDRAFLDHAVKKLVAVHSEFEIYRKVGFWPARAFFQMILRVRSNKHREILRNPNRVKARKRRGKAPAVQDNAPVPAGQPAHDGNPAVESEPAPTAPQGENEADDGELFNFEDLSDDEEDDEPHPLDTTMHEATRLNVNPNATVDMSCDLRDDDDDGGAFDISQTAGLTLAPQAANTGAPPRKTASARSDRSSAPADVTTPASATPSSTAPAKSSGVPGSKPSCKSALVAQSRTPTPPPPPSPPPSSPAMS
ncbi:hypothetical protein FRC08_015509 [Ceratobasidium sp. 394]|nr:hypothetical protein FRC08_015509 [Ceratobasidium sp. 394]